MLLNNNIKYSDKDIIEKGAKVLIKELGYSGFLRFIKQIESSGGEDYIAIQDDIYKNASLDDIFESASKTWQNKKK